MQTLRKPSPAFSPGSAMLSSISFSAKKCDLPLPRPPCAPLYRAGASNGWKTGAVSILRVVKDHPFDLLELHGIIFVAGVRDLVAVLLRLELAGNPLPSVQT